LAFLHEWRSPAGFAAVPGPAGQHRRRTGSRRSSRRTA